VASSRDYRIKYRYDDNSSGGNDGNDNDDDDDNNKDDDINDDDDDDDDDKNSLSNTSWIITNQTCYCPRIYIFILIKEIQVFIANVTFNIRLEQIIDHISFFFFPTFSSGDDA